nr:MAG TPA: hypothetical protein [Caudoviricetes sp.]
MRLYPLCCPLVNLLKRGTLQAVASCRCIAQVSTRWMCNN